MIVNVTTMTVSGAPYPVGQPPRVSVFLTTSSPVFCWRSDQSNSDRNVKLPHMIFSLSEPRNSREIIARCFRKRSSMIITHQVLSPLNFIWGYMGPCSSLWMHKTTALFSLNMTKTKQAYDRMSSKIQEKVKVRKNVLEFGIKISGDFEQWMYAHSFETFAKCTRLRFVLRFGEILSNECLLYSYETFAKCTRLRFVLRFGEIWNNE